MRNALLCRRPPKNNIEQLNSAIQSLALCRQQCEAVVRKNERMSSELKRDAVFIAKSAETVPKERVLHILRQRRMVEQQIEKTRLFILSTFRHQLTLEQAILTSNIGDAIVMTNNALRSSVGSIAVDRAEEMQEALHEMTAAVCDVSTTISEATNDMGDFDEEELEHELVQLLVELEVPSELMFPTVPTGPVVAVSGNSFANSS